MSLSFSDVRGHWQELSSRPALMPQPTVACMCVCVCVCVGVRGQAAKLKSQLPHSG